MATTPVSADASELTRQEAVATGGLETTLSSPSPTTPKKPAKPAPTFAQVAYGNHERQTLDFWKASSANPTPLVFFMHGGGWVKDDTSQPAIETYLRNGISVVSIRYRYSWQAQLAGVSPPLKWPMTDAARALQFVRSKASEWNIDTDRIGVSGQSAGACTTLWLALHPDMADPTSSDPVARQSTSPFCVAVSSAQTSLDPQQMKEWTPNSRYGGGAFGFMNPKDIRTRDKNFAEFLANRDKLLSSIKKYSPIEHVSPDDPPVYMIYKAPPALGQPQKDPTHTANFGVKLKEKLDQAGVECELVYPGATGVKHANIEAYFIGKLKK
ncbi:MAG: alpha/beta hydrolase [Luteolibacter sp.]